jgi:hypothetical protein
MAQIASTPSSTTGFELPEPKLPKLDLGALFAARKADLAAAHEAQAVLVDAIRAVAKVQQGRVEQAVADAKAAFEKNVAATKEVADLTVAAQRRVVELFTQRARANSEELKAAA